MNTTNIKKDGSDIVGSVDIDYADFLKRMFRSEGGLVYPAISKDTLYGMLNWVRKNKDIPDRQQFADNVYAALAEFAYHGEAEYVQQREYLSRVLNSIGKALPSKVYHDHIYMYWN
jgi:hypothetical protein